MSIRRWLVAAAAALALPTSGAGATYLNLTHAYREFVDRGDITATIHPTDGAALECPTSVSYAQSGNRITLTVRKAPPGQSDTGPCSTSASVVLGPYAVGRYEVTARVRSVDGLSFDSTMQIMDILPIDGRCNPDPALSPSIIGTPKGETAEAFVARVKADPALAASLGNPAVRLKDYQYSDDEVWFDYPPLEDIAPAMDRLQKSGHMRTLFRSGHVCFATPPPDTVAQFVEFHHAGLDHYFYSGDAGEITAIDAGQVGAGWSRTGKFFRATTVPGCAFAGGQTVVYRFFGIPGFGPNSHFFTRDRAECSVVDRSAKWSFEGLPFWASAPGVDGSCPSGTVPLYRAWRPFGDSNHRFTTDRAVIAQMVAKAWVDEGAAMCVLPPQ
jgi:hypothetical protein